jgi:hypothetical protein
MKKFRNFLSEDLYGALVEPQSKASQEASKLSLTYVGFGRYEDPNTQQITHIVQNDRLIPFAKATKTNTFSKQSGDDFGEYNKNLMPEIEQHNKDLSNAYLPETYSDQELDAIENYSSLGYVDINDRLRSLPAGIPAEQIEPTYQGDPIPSQVAALDSALYKSVAPKDFITYAALSGAYSLDSFKSGQILSFKGFRSTTLNPSVALNLSNSYNQDSGRKTSFLLQIHVKKGSNGMYVNEFSNQPGESEFLLPRNTAIRIIEGPSKLVGSNKYTDELNHEVFFFGAETLNMPSNKRRR